MPKADKIAQLKAGTGILDAAQVLNLSGKGRVHLQPKINPNGGSIGMNSKAPKVAKNFIKIKYNCDVELVDGQKMVPKTYIFMIDKNAGGNENGVRVKAMKKKVADDTLVPFGLIKVIKIKDDSESDDDNDIPYIHPVFGLGNEHRLTLGEKYTCTIEKSLAKNFPKDITPDEVDDMGEDACEQFCYIQGYKGNKNFTDATLMNAITDMKERNHLAMAIIRYRRETPKSWFSYKDKYGTGVFMKACAYRDDVCIEMLDAEVVDNDAVNCVNEWKSSCLTGIIERGFSNVALRYFKHPGLKVSACTEAGPTPNQNNVQYAWERFNVQRRRNQNVLHAEAQHKHMIKGMLTDPWRGDENYFLKGMLEDAAAVPMNKTVLYSDRMFDLTNDWYVIFEALANFCKKKGNGIEKFLYNEEVQDWEKVANDKMLFNPLERRKSWDELPVFEQEFKKDGKLKVKVHKKKKKDRWRTLNADAEQIPVYDLKMKKAGFNPPMEAPLVKGVLVTK